jgi:hypothetical protein
LSGAQPMEYHVPESIRDRSNADRLAIVHRLYDAFARRRIDEILPLLAPDVEWSEPENPLNPAGGTRHGHAGFLEWARTGAGAEEILSLVPHKELTGPDALPWWAMRGVRRAPRGGSTTRTSCTWWSFGARRLSDSKSSSTRTRPQRLFARRSPRPAKLPNPARR